MKRQKITAVLLRILVYVATIITVGALLFVVGYILYKGVPNLSWKLFEWKYTTENLSLMPALLTGLISVLAPFCIMQPAFGFGFAAAKTPTPNRARRRSLLAHLTFGAGLFVAGWLLIQLFPGSVCLGQG